MKYLNKLHKIKDYMEYRTILFSLLQKIYLLNFASAFFNSKLDIIFT